MSKCNKVKNPCKICLGPVTQKTGLHCKGACDSWVHYNCLNYTPGRIKDIKAGIIKVTCPCPDCKTILPKEYRTDEPFSCTNMGCPANRPPQCVNVKCPMNGGAEKMNQTSVCKIPPPPCPLAKCGNECKGQSFGPPGCPSPLSPPCDNRHIARSSVSDACISIGEAKRAFCPVRNVNNLPSLGTMEQMCNTIGALSNQINAMMTKMRDATNAQPSKCVKPCHCPSNPATRR